MLDGLERDLISGLRKLANFPGGDALTMRIAGRCMALEPRHHGRTGGKRFPAAVETARASRTGRIDNVMPNFGMSTVHATIEFAIEDDSPSDSRTHGHVDQAGAIPARAPTSFGERGSVTIVFERNPDLENLDRKSVV